MYRIPSPLIILNLFDSGNLKKCFETCITFGLSSKIVSFVLANNLYKNLGIVPPPKPIHKISFGLLRNNAAIDIACV